MTANGEIAMATGRVPRIGKATALVLLNDGYTVTAHCSCFRMSAAARWHGIALSPRHRPDPFQARRLAELEQGVAGRSLSKIAQNGWLNRQHAAPARSSCCPKRAITHPLHTNWVPSLTGDGSCRSGGTSQRGRDLLSSTVSFFCPHFRLPREVLKRQRPDGWAPVDAIWSRLAASSRIFTDSTNLLREDRER